MTAITNGGVMQRSMSFLIDTNIIIVAEPFAGQIEESHREISAFLSNASRHKHTVCVHPASRDDMQQTADALHRRQNLAALAKYAMLDETAVAQEVWDCFPEHPSPNDQRDARILAALHAGATDFLVTNDRRLRARAARLGHETRVFGAAEAAHRLRLWHPEAPFPPPTVELIPSYHLDLSQEIFRSLRDDYEAFDVWAAKVKRDFGNRRCWVVRDSDGRYNGVAIVKTSDELRLGYARQAIKISTLKVARHAAGRRLGELLLKSVLRWAHAEPNRPGEIFVEVRNDKAALIDFLHEFGFTREGDKTPHEGIYVKPLNLVSDQASSPLEYHVRFGPPALLIGQPIYLVPIQPMWFDGLFPDAEVLGASNRLLLPGTNLDVRAHGNAIRKAYLCRAPQKTLQTASILLFYRSQGSLSGDGAVSAVGIVESTHRSTDPGHTTALSLKRTVYTSEEIMALHKGGRSVLTILFRHDRFLEPTWSLSELISHKVVTSAPQSVTRVRDGKGITWIEERLSESR